MPKCLRKGFPFVYNILHNMNRAGMMVALGIFWAAGSSFAGEEGACMKNPRHVIVYHDAETFAGFPANEGGWSWGNEILVAFKTGGYKEKQARGHSIDAKAPRAVRFARSLDGGVSWNIEAHQNVTEPRMVSKNALAFPERRNLDACGLAVKVRDNVMWFSENRGRIWENPAQFIQDDEWASHARTSYVVTGENSAFFFISGARKNHPKTDAKRNRSTVWRTKDGGKTFGFLSLIGAPGMFDSTPRSTPAYSIMPSVVRLAEKHYVCAVRECISSQKWVRIYESRDDCATWKGISTIAKDAHNPAALVSPGGKRLVAIYGSRETKTKGMFAVVSDDAGFTWSQPIVLRNDARTWDFGYPRAFVRPDGVIVAVYYYTTKEQPQQHIAATLWKPPAALTP